LSARRRGGRGGSRGAVYVEFLIAFFPLFAMFMSTIQFAAVMVADLVVKLAAEEGARAAVVILPDSPAYYASAPVNQATGDRVHDIESAVRTPLLAVVADPGFEVRFPLSAGGTDSRLAFGADDLVRVHVDLDYPCRVPVGRLVVCGPGGRRRISGEAALPNQGAGYSY
jgi:Flp pilus assembly protein TadG